MLIIRMNKFFMSSFILFFRSLFTFMKKKSSYHFEIYLFNQRWLRKELIQNIRERSTGMERRKVYPPNTNMSLNRKCWNTFMISRMTWERRDGRRKKLQRFLRPHFWGVKTQMQNWGLSLSDVSLESCHYIVVTFVPQLLIGS